jgi:ZIP family zinc transporter
VKVRHRIAGTNKIYWRTIVLEVIYAFLAGTGTWLCTVAGAATVFFFKKQRKLNILLGASAGIMVSASFWSLLKPAVELAPANSAFYLVTLSFLAGSAFILLSDKLLRFIQCKNKASGSLRRIFMLVFAITLHNIPEGLAVGVAFGAAANSANHAESIVAAGLIALGIGLQDFPEGAAVALPLRREGYSRIKSFLLGQASGLVEPIAAVIGAILVIYIIPLLPVALAFAAGAMIFVTIHELIPEAQQDRILSPYAATIGIIAGFAVMMFLDLMFTL